MKKPVMTIGMDLIGDDLKIDPFIVDPKDPTGVYNLSVYIPKVIDLLFTACKLGDVVEVILSDGTSKVLPREQVIFNVLLWRILLACRIPVTEKYVYNFTVMTETTLADYHNKIYDICLEQNPQRGRIYALFADSINLQFNISIRYAMDKVTSLSYYDMLAMYNDPVIVEMREYLKPKDFESTKDFEVKAKTLTKELEQYIKNHPSDNPIKQLYLGGKLNPSQIFQTFLAYGPRADLDQHLLGSAILTNTMAGYQSLSDYGKESVSAKISAVFNRAMVRKAAVSMKMSELIMTELYNLHIDRVCDNNSTIPFYFEPGKPDRYIGKHIVVDGKELIINKDNFNDYAGTEVNMVSAVDCKFRDGCCYRCLGELYKYIDHTNHLGMRIASEAFSDFMQLILSAKHLSTSDTIPYVLPPEASVFIQPISNSSFRLEPLPEGYKVGFDATNMGSPDQIDVDNIPAVREASWIERMYIFDKEDKIVNVVNLTSADGNRPHLTERFYKYLKDHPEYYQVHRGVITGEVRRGKKVVTDLNVVDLRGWSFKRATAFKTHNRNRDIPAYVKSVDTFFRTKAVNYRDRATALKEFADLIYQKSELHVGFLEMLLRGLIVTDQDNMEIGTMLNSDDVLFAKGAKVISGRTFCTGMIYQDQLSLKRGQGLLYRPDTYLHPKSPGRFGGFLGLSNAGRRRNL